MTDYTQLTDDELRRKVRELMGYRVVPRYTSEVDEFELCQSIGRGKYSLIISPSTLTEAEAWKYAPDPLTNANVYMKLVDEMASLYYDVTLDICVLICSVLASKDKDNEYEANNARLSRAICEVYCQVKEKE